MDQNTLHLTSLAYSLYSPVISGDLRIFTPAVCSGLCIEKMFSFYGEIFRGTCSGISASPVHICGSYLNHFQSLTNGEGASIYCRKPQPCCLGSLLLRDINSPSLSDLCMSLLLVSGLCYGIEYEDGLYSTPFQECPGASNYQEIPRL